MSSAQAEAAAMELVRGIEAEIEVAEPTLVAAAATADFGIEEGLRRVVIRVVDGMRVQLTLRSETVVPLAEPPGLCLVGPFWNPLDAGLSDRCWGDPDFATVVAPPPDKAGDGPRLAQGSTTVESALTRGHERCDYAPGEWHLEVTVRPVVDGQAFGPVRIPNVTFEVPFDESEALALLPFEDTRVCSYPAAVVNRQGEPELVEP
jgi:hypothetical protein